MPFLLLIAIHVNKIIFELKYRILNWKHWKLFCAFSAILFFFTQHRKNKKNALCIWYDWRHQARMLVWVGKKPSFFLKKKKRFCFSKNLKYQFPLWFFGLLFRVSAVRNLGYQVRKNYFIQKLRKTDIKVRILPYSPDRYRM